MIFPTEFEQNYQAMPHFALFYTSKYFLLVPNVSELLAGNILEFINITQKEISIYEHQKFLRMIDISSYHHIEKQHNFSKSNGV